MTKPFVTSLKKKKFVEPQSIPFKVSFRHGDDNYEGEYSAVFSIFDGEIAFSADSKEQLQVLLLSVALFFGSSAENLDSIPLGG